jgi:hypothetical protein
MKDLLSKKFGELEVVEKSSKVDNQYRTFWISKCSCGKTVETRIDRLISGKTRSCGHLSNSSKGLMANKGRSALTKLYTHYKESARSHSRVFDIPMEYFERLVTQNCYYCNSKPANVVVVGVRKDTIIYNGLDRVDNQKGYTLENVVPCCEICNRGKRTKDFSFFTNWISSISGFSLVGMLNKRVGM